MNCPIISRDQRFLNLNCANNSLYIFFCSGNYASFTTHITYDSPFISSLTPTNLILLIHVIIITSKKNITLKTSFILFFVNIFDRAHYPLIKDVNSYGRWFAFFGPLFRSSEFLINVVVNVGIVR